MSKHLTLDWKTHQTTVRSARVTLGNLDNAVFTETNGTSKLQLNHQLYGGGGEVNIYLEGEHALRQLATILHEAGLKPYVKADT